MLKYCENLVRTYTLLKEERGFDLLQYLEHFPIDRDPWLRIYEKIAARIVAVKKLRAHHGTRNRYYINKVRPFFTGSRIYYEVNLVGHH